MSHCASVFQEGNQAKHWVRAALQGSGRRLGLGHEWRRVTLWGGCGCARGVCVLGQVGASASVVMAVSPVEAHRVIAVLEETLEKLTFLDRCVASPMLCLGVDWHMRRAAGVRTSGVLSVVGWLWPDPG